MLCSLVHNISFSYRGSCFIWRDSVGSLWCSKWKYGSHSGTAISYKWFGFQFTFFYFIQCYYFTFFSFDMDSKSWALSVPVFLFQLVAYVDKLGRGTPGVMLSWSRLLNSWSCWNFPPYFYMLWTWQYGSHLVTTTWLCYRRKLRKGLWRF